MHHPKQLVLWALSLCMVGPAYSKQHPITVSASSNTVNYKHQPKDGYKGTVIVSDGDVVTWTCDSQACMSVKVEVTSSLCTEGLVIGPGKSLNCTVMDSTPVDSIKYKITVDKATDDPYIIVDNQGHRPHGPKPK